LANLSKGEIGEENSNLLGALLVTTIQIAAMSRVNIPEKKEKISFCILMNSKTLHRSFRNHFV